MRQGRDLDDDSFECRRITVDDIDRRHDMGGLFTEFVATAHDRGHQGRRLIDRIDGDRHRDREIVGLGDAEEPGDRLDQRLDLAEDPRQMLGVVAHDDLEAVHQRLAGHQCVGGVDELPGDEVAIHPALLGLDDVVGQDITVGVGGVEVDVDLAQDVLLVDDGPGHRCPVDEGVADLPSDPRHHRVHQDIQR
ncbi:hypothetical protein O6072_26570 [Mycolicibacterium neoaurum]|uniref:hypothetical protein n=1 Tax=Mycolicibacterium neoaurum TaxID=1795 RepID=UPI00248C6CC8|nr:hypothetical protein [Mycolicibacterium neoaurum]WBS08314.1 hypothetical protein O6072_26570 [Mycolicibacterium neoaurum]